MRSLFYPLEIYTDGSCKDGLGTWAFVIVCRGKVICEKSGIVGKANSKANSNVMEIQAAIEALSLVNKKSKIRLFSDSKILIDAMNGIETPKAFESKLDQLKGLSENKSIQWQWVKAHHGNVYNEHCDRLCVLARGN